MCRPHPYGRGCPFLCPIYGKKPEYRAGSCPVAEQRCKDIFIMYLHPPEGIEVMKCFAGAFRKVVDGVEDLKKVRREVPRESR